MLRLFVGIEFCSGMNYLITQVTWVTEHVGIVMRFHMVPCAGTVLMRKLVTESAVEPSIFWAPAHKLE